jgi:uncharacterized damage-inducible protein DinB
MEIRLKFERLLSHDHWANGQALASLEALQSPPAKPCELMAHVLGAEVAWLDRMTVGRDPEDWQKWETADLAWTRRCWQEEVPQRWASFLGYAAHADPERSFSYVNFEGKSFTAKVEDAVLQLMLHGAYHRGQVATAVRAAGGEPAVVDYIRAIRSGAIV